MFEIPEFAWEFHGHRCPFMPIGYRMGKIAMEKLGLARSRIMGPLRSRRWVLDILKLV